MKKSPYLVVFFLLLFSAGTAHALTMGTWADNGHEYAIVELAGETWIEASSNMTLTLGNDYYLATITSPEEESFILSLLADYYNPENPGNRDEWWIGASDATTEGTWEWVNGEGVFYKDGAKVGDAYVNWYGNEPSGDGDYAALDYRNGWMWNDECSMLPAIDGYIAEKSAPVPEPATMLLVGIGVAGLAGFRRKFKNR